jgi:hypothetical protein
MTIYLDAIERHVMALRDGEDIAPDSKVHHIGHIIACGAILADAIYGGFVVDDRPAEGPAWKLLAQHVKTAATPAIPSMTEAVQESAGRRLADAPKIVRDWLDATDLSEEARAATLAWLRGQPVVSAELGGGS